MASLDWILIIDMISCPGLSIGEPWPPGRDDPARRARTQFVPEMGPGHQKCKAFLVQIKGIFPTKSHRFEVEYIVDLSFIF